MFTKQHDTALADLSTDLCDETDWRVGILRTFTFPLNVSAVAVEPLAGLIAIGTADSIVYIFGGPGVESKISLPEPGVAVRFLHFSISTYFLLCFDETNQLHIYNLLEYGRPKIVTSARFDRTNSLTLSPSHTHVFLSMQNGEIRTYDLTCLRKSPYIVPNLWKMYEKDLVAKGVPPLASPAPQETIDVVIHPRDLNLLFVAYAGGVILMDLTERNTIRAYELVLQPGAPGGAGYGTEDILTHRRLMVTCMAVHPTGHFFAVGYTDGSIAFWAVDDDSKPLVTRTLDDDHVDTVDQDLLRVHLDTGYKSSNRSRFVREPVYKLSWSGFPNSSDPRGGETVMTVLGGVVAPKRTTVTILCLPAFNPQAPPVDNSLSQTQLHPEFRRAMYESVMPRGSHSYELHGRVQDYILLPKNDPHFGGAYDPYAILFVLDVENARTVEAFEFPPPNFVQTQLQVETPNQKEQPVEPTSPGSSTSPSGSTFRKICQSPLDFVTPFALSNARSLVRSGRIFTLRNDVYDNFVLQNFSEDGTLKLKGGLAYPDSGQLNSLRLSKYQPRRILLTFNEDKTVRFFDLSTTLLIASENESLKHAWPKPITPLSIRLDDILRDPSFSERLSTDCGQVSIQFVQVATEALEVAMSLGSGELLVYTTRKLAHNPSSPKRSDDKEIVLLDHISSPRETRLKPFFMLCPGKSQVQTFAISDIGFLAISCRDGSLTIIDMRGPRIILSPVTNKRHKRRSQGLSPTETGPDIVTSLTWSVCPLDKDSRIRVRLIAVSQSGIAEIYNLVCLGNPATWSVMDDIIICKASPDALPNCTFVLDAKSGAQLPASPARLSMTFRSEQPPLEKGTRCLLVSVGAKQVRVTANVNGEKVGKVELGSKLGSVVSSQVLGHNQSHALLLQTDKNNALAYSLPHLEHIATVQLPNLSPLPLTIDESGDFIAWSLSSSKGRRASQAGPQQISTPLINGATYGTFFDLNRAYTHPDVDLAATFKTPPPQPQPISLGPVSFLGGLGAWLPFNQTISGEAIDELLGGPDRPIPEKIVHEKTKSAAEDAADGSTDTTTAAIAASAAAVQTSLYNKLSGVLGERGQLLGDLEDRIQSLGEGSRNMAAQAKRLAAQQTAKSWFGF